MSENQLVAALREIERHVAHGGWDQPARLFALVGTAQLIAAEPSLAEQLARSGDPDPDALSSIEQDGFRTGEDLLDDLARITWPPTVQGCALAVERAFVPADVEPDIPDDPEQAAAFVAQHPRRHEVRVVVGATRAGAHYGIARLRAAENELLAGDDLVPGLALALSRTLAQ